MTWWDAEMRGWGARTPSSKKTVCKVGPGGALKIGQVLNCERLDFRAEVLKLGGVKGLQGGREHSSDVMTECIFND